MSQQDLILKLLRHRAFGPRLWALANVYEPGKLKADIVDQAGIEYSQFTSLAFKVKKVSILWELVALLHDHPELFTRDRIWPVDPKPKVEQEEPYLDRVPDNDTYVPPWEQ